MKKIFKNCAIQFDPEKEHYFAGSADRDFYNYYRFRNISPYLYNWSRFLQVLLSMACSKMINGEWRLKDHAIYKCEGGIRVSGIGEVVLCPDYLYADYSRNPDKETKEKIKKVQELVSKIILNWDPMSPSESMFKITSEHIGVPVEEVKQAFEKCESPRAFGGDSLSYLFNHNPFGKFKVDRDYIRYCLVNFASKGEAEVDDMFSVEDLSEKLLKDLNAAVRKYKQYGCFLCASPKEFNDGTINFWLNDGIYYGWHTEDEILQLIQWIEKNQKVPKNRDEVFIDAKV